MAGGGFVKSLAGEGEVKISFLKRNGKRRTLTVWFALDGKQLELLPLSGLKTK